MSTRQAHGLHYGINLNNVRKSLGSHPKYPNTNRLLNSYNIDRAQVALTELLRRRMKQRTGTPARQSQGHKIEIARLVRALVKILEIPNIYITWNGNRTVRTYNRTAIRRNLL